MALKLNFREVTPEDTEILRMIALGFYTRA